MNILVTGGAGYIGSVTTAQLIEKGHNVVVYDSLVKGHRKAVHQEAIFVKGDIADKKNAVDSGTSGSSSSSDSGSPTPPSPSGNGTTFSRGTTGGFGNK